MIKSRLHPNSSLMHHLSLPHPPPPHPLPGRLDFPCLLAVNISCHVAAAAPRQPYLLLARRRRRARRPLEARFILHFQLTVVRLLHKRIHHAAATPLPLTIAVLGLPVFVL